MANFDFLKKLLSPDFTLSPMDSEDAKAGRDFLEEQRLREEDPMAFMPAEEAIEPEEPVGGRQLASQKEIADIKSIPGSEMDRIPKATSIPKIDDNQLPEVNTVNRYQQLLEAYNNRNRNLGLAQAGNQLAQAIAAGHGAKIGSGSEAIQALQAQNISPDKQIAAEDEAKMADPNSDISKMYREQAYASLKKISPNSDYSGKLDNMSASQLLKSPILKALSQQQASPWIATDRVDSNGNPIRFNKQTGEYSLADGSVVRPGDKTVRDIARRDALTGKYGYVNAGSGMNVVPTNYGTAPLEKNPETGKSREVTYGEFARNAPEQVKEFNKIRDQFNKDMQESRDVATSVTNLTSKLKPGPNNEIDSGLLGSIQTQAAKMAGQKGVLTDQDLVKFAGAGGVSAKIQRIVDGSLFGEMSDEDIKFFKRFSQLMGKSLNEDILNRSQLYTEQARQIVDTTMPGVSGENVAKMLGVDKVAPIVQDAKITSNVTGMVKMKLPNGNTVNIPKENVQKAKARGAVEVK